MHFSKPKLPEYDIAEWLKAPFAERIRSACVSWALDGYGAPPLVHLAYVLKAALYVLGWFWFCSFSASLGSPLEVSGWWWKWEALQKAVLWSLAFESLGLGCGSGPLTGRYLPPFTACLHFLRPGTVKMPLLPRLPLLGGNSRTWFDVLLYAGCLVFLLRGLTASELSLSDLGAVAAALSLMGIADRTVFLAARSDHYFVVLVCLLFPLDGVAGVKWVWLALWFWAATSKLNRHFPAVVCVMLSNSAVMRFASVRRRLYRDYPGDLRPSRLAQTLAHSGTAMEYCVPLLLVLGDGGAVTLVGLVVMCAFHGFITSHIPMGVPVEWNVMMVYGGFVLFGKLAGVSLLSVSSPWLMAWLIATLVALPVLGNLYPGRVSFLHAMRYYAGNWAFSIWLFRDGASEKLNAIKKAAGMPREQITRLYDSRMADVLTSRIVSFRCMHLHGRVLSQLVPQVVDDVDRYEWVDGEIMAGVVLGWNFGDGHLHNERLLEAVQERCGFESGELCCIFVEAEPAWPRQGSLHYRYVDACDGALGEGDASVEQLELEQPWPGAPLDGKEPVLAGTPDVAIAGTRIAETTDRNQGATPS